MSSEVRFDCEKPATTPVGWLLIFGGWTHLLLGWHVRAAGGLVWQLVLGFLYILAGSYLLLDPLAGLPSLMIAVAVYLFAAGNIEFILFFRLRQPRGSSWLLVDGAIALVLAILILGTLPGRLLGSWHTGGNQHPFQRYFPFGPVTGGAPCYCLVCIHSPKLRLNR